VGLTSKDIGIKFSSRQVVQSVLDNLKVTGDEFARTCVIVDKLDKSERSEVEKQLEDLGIAPEIAKQIIDSLALKDLSELAKVMGEGHPVLKQLKDLVSYAESYGFADWLQFDATVIRGLGYYTGVVFEAFDRTGQIPRAICGGGRYDHLLSTYGARDQPACGFGFGDCVILEILKDKKLLPSLEPVVDDVVLALSEEFRGPAIQVAEKLRGLGRSVDVVLGKKKKATWAYSYADKLGAKRVLLLAPTEWSQGKVRVKWLRQSKGRGQDADNEENVAFEELS